ncbi:MAG TPA: sugar transferase [Bryobacteraceae bacterium]|nr:sugar transferase [Bryobacteraceae bacterium]
MIRLFRVFVPTSVLALIVSEIVLVSVCFILGTAFVIDTDLEIFFLYEGGLARMLLVVASVMLGLYLEDFYTEFRIRSKAVLVQQLCLVIGMVFFSQALLTYINPNLMMSRWVMIYGCGLILVLLPVWRVVYTSVVFRALGAQRLLFLGTNAIALNIADRLAERPELGFANVGFIDDQRELGEELAGSRVLGGLSSLKAVVDREQPDLIVVGLTERRLQLPVYDLLDMRFTGIRIEEAAITFETAFGRVSTVELRPSQLIFSAELGPQQRSLGIQLAYSFVLALIGMVLLLPVMIVVALAVWLTSPGPVLFRQKRVGLNGSTFLVYKFRSMRTDAEATTGAVWATRDDPRVTPIGKWLRRLRLDELPQLFNVLRSEMSIVGPRPERPEFVNTLSEQIPFYRQRHCVRPGITGWAQINYKYGETIEDTIIKLEYDLYYIKNLSPSLDAYIIFHTMKVMLFSQSGQ